MGKKYICNHPGIYQPLCAGCYEESYSFIKPFSKIPYKTIRKWIKKGILVGKLRKYK